MVRIPFTFVFFLSQALKTNKSIFKVMVEVPDGEDEMMESMVLSQYQSIQRACALNLQSLFESGEAVLPDDELSLFPDSGARKK
eukprot:m.252554 g.252554  ORF g.252554 m.252554 type:complete len:84 (+) comp16155_c0_seq28:1708-1959(+)